MDIEIVSIDEYDVDRHPKTGSEVRHAVRPMEAVARLEFEFLRRHLGGRDHEKYALYEERPATDDKPETPVVTFSYPSDGLMIKVTLNLQGIDDEFHINVKLSIMLAGLGVHADHVILDTRKTNSELILEILPHKHATKFHVSRTGELELVDTIPLIDE